MIELKNINVTLKRSRKIQKEYNTLGSMEEGTSIYFLKPEIYSF